MVKRILNEHKKYISAFEKGDYETLDSLAESHIGYSNGSFIRAVFKAPEKSRLIGNLSAVNSGGLTLFFREELIKLQIKIEKDMRQDIKCIHNNREFDDIFVLKNNGE